MPEFSVFNSLEWTRYAAKLERDHWDESEPEGGGEH